MKISRSILNDAKAFLSWDVFDDVAVQLVPLHGAAAFYYPPTFETHSIVLFFDHKTTDFSEPLFLLFHEAGHRRQYDFLGKKFDKKVATPNGPQRQNFELEAWQLARLFLEEFTDLHHYRDETLLSRFDQFAQKSIKSYTDNSQG